MIKQEVTVSGIQMYTVDSNCRHVCFICDVRDITNVTEMIEQNPLFKRDQAERAGLLLL